MRPGFKATGKAPRRLALAQKHRQRVVFVGDSRQHVSVEAGDFLRILETHSKLESRELKNVRRQIADDYRQAVIAMADGKTAAGMEQLDAMGWIHEGKAGYLQEAAKAWMEKSEARRQRPRTSSAWLPHGKKTSRCLGRSAID